MTDIVAGSHQTVSRSTEMFERAVRLLPGGVNSPVRAFTAVGGTPLFITRGEGPFLWDVDNNRYIDYVMSWGPLIHGHAYAPVVQAIQTTASLGTTFGAPTSNEVTLAQLVIECFPSIDMVRFVSSGTEAAMSAIRLARGYTGRDLIVKFAGNYHGHADMLLAESGSGGLTLGVPSSPGVPVGAAKSTLVLPYNNAVALHRTFDELGSEIACVIVEPIAGNMGVIPPAEGFLETIRSLTSQAGGLFICDEVITGFRVAPGGAQSLYGIEPDITILGKIIGGGLPVGAYGGQRQVMEHLAPLGPVYQAGTLSGNPLAMAAGIANLLPLRDRNFFVQLDDMTTRLAQGLTDAARHAGVRVTVNRCCGLLTVFFNDHPVGNLDDAKHSNTQQYSRFFHAMLRRGIYLPPSQFEAWMISSSHGTEIIDRTVQAATEAFIELLGHHDGQ